MTDRFAYTMLMPRLFALVALACTVAAAPAGWLYGWPVGGVYLGCAVLLVPVVRFMAVQVRWLREDRRRARFQLRQRMLNQPDATVRLLNDLAGR